MDESADESHKPKRKRPGTASRKKVQPIHLSEEGQLHSYGYFFICN